jgi:hypothetical protein
VSIINFGVSLCAVSQPPAYANKPTIPAITMPIVANRRIKLALGNSAMGVCAFMAFLLFKESCARRRLSADNAADCRGRKLAGTGDEGELKRAITALRCEAQNSGNVDGLSGRAQHRRAKRSSVRWRWWVTE